MTKRNERRKVQAKAATYEWVKFEAGRDRSLALKLGVNESGIRIVSGSGIAIEMSAEYSLTRLLMEMLSKKEEEALYQQMGFLCNAIMQMSDPHMHKAVFAMTNLYYNILTHQKEYAELASQSQLVPSDLDPGADLEGYLEKRLELVKQYNAIRDTALEEPIGKLIGFIEGMMVRDEGPMPHGTTPEEDAIAEERQKMEDEKWRQGQAAIDEMEKATNYDGAISDWLHATVGEANRTEALKGIIGSVDGTPDMSEFWKAAGGLRSVGLVDEQDYNDIIVALSSLLAEGKITLSNI